MPAKLLSGGPKPPPQTWSPKIIGITGESGSGKSYIAQSIASAIGPDCLHLRLDDYYRDLTHLPTSERKTKNFDVPSAIDWASFLTTIKHLNRGLPASTPQYDFNTHSRLPGYSLKHPAPIVIIEGLWLFLNARLESIYHQRIYIDCPPELRLRRRIERDTVSRGRTANQIVEQYERHVQPFEKQWVRPQKKAADWVIQSPLSTETIDQLVIKILASN